jgi:hypothetical protein
MSQQAALETTAFFARIAIAEGADPQGLVHIQHFPRDYDGHQPGEVLGLSTPLPAGSDLSGYINDYYTLAELAVEQ